MTDAPSHDLALARAVDALVAGVAAIGLEDVRRALAELPPPPGDIAPEITPSLASRLLRSRGFHKAGTIGTGSDRQPLYTCAQPALPLL